MNADTLLSHFERISDAPDAVDRLRRFILDLAVRGRLVEQDPREESANELLKAIATLRGRHDALRSRRPQASSEEFAALPRYDLPATWKWVRLDAIGSIIGGGTPAAGDSTNFAEPGQGIPWLTPADLGKQKTLLVSRGRRDLTPKGLEESSATVIPEGAVLFTSRAPIGYVAIAANELSTNQGFKSIVPYERDSSRYVALVLQAYAPAVDAIAPGTTFKEVSGKLVASLPFPLPPLAEQYRIVEKVDELMMLCDRLESSQRERDSRRDRLVMASLNRLSLPTDPDEFKKDAGFQLSNLNRLSTKPEHIKEIRKAILNLAVRGKLVPQDEDAVSVHVALGLIAPEDSTGLPVDWVRLTLGQIALRMDSGWSPQCENVRRTSVEEWAVLRTTSVQPLAFDCQEHKRLPDKLTPRPQYEAQEGDLLVTRAGPRNRVGVCCVAERVEPRLMISDKLIRVHLRDGLFPRFVALALNTGESQEAIEAAKSGMAVMQMNISQDKLRTIPIPLPPLAEQKRIVAKVDELMLICDQLETQLESQQKGRRQLLEALLHEALDAVG